MPDLEIYYSIARQYAEDLTLAGSETILQAELSEDDTPATTSPVAPNPRPLLAVVDSRGRVSQWQKLRESGHWRDVIAVCSHSTPGEYLQQLQAAGVEYVLVGEDRVDLSSALGIFYSSKGVRAVRVESGGVLNGVLLEAGLVDELSILVHPLVVGSQSEHSLLGSAVSGIRRFELFASESREGGLVWLRYRM